MCESSYVEKIRAACLFGYQECKARAMTTLGFSFDLSGLHAKDSVERALQEKMERGKQEPFKTVPLGGGIDNEPDAPLPEDEKIVTLSAAWLLALRGACIKPTSPYYGYLNAFTKMLYVFQFMMCAAAAVASAIYPRWIDWDLLDWFGWSVFGAFVLGELTFIYIRLLGRWSEVGKPGRYDNVGLQEWFESLVIRRRKFGARWQAFTIVTIQLMGSFLTLWGIMVMMMQMMLDQEDDVRATVRREDRGWWTHLWTSIFAAVAAFQVAAASLDPTRVGELDSRSCAVDLTATRVVVMILVIPLLAPAFCVYANVCCEGDWQL